MNFIINYISRFPPWVHTAETVLLKSSIGSLTQPVMQLIFDYLAPKELGRACLINKEWMDLTSEDFLWQKFSLENVYQWSKVINKDVWQRYGVEVTGGEDVPLGRDRNGVKRLVEKLDNLAEQVEGDAKLKLTLLTMVGSINLNGVLAIAAANGVPPGYVWPRIIEEIGAEPVAQTNTIVITNSVLKGSRNKTFDEQQIIADNLGYAMPKALEAAALNIVTYMESPSENRVRLYGNNPRTVTRCSDDEIDADFDDEVVGERLVVGSFDFTGLRISSGYNDAKRVGIAVCATLGDLESPWADGQDLQRLFR